MIDFVDFLVAFMLFLPAIILIISVVIFLMILSNPLMVVLTIVAIFGVVEIFNDKKKQEGEK